MEGAIWKRHKEVSEVLVMVYSLICVVVTQECLLCDKSLSCMLMICAFFFLHIRHTSFESLFYGKME